MIISSEVIHLALLLYFWEYGQVECSEFCFYLFTPKFKNKQTKKTTTDKNKQTNKNHTSKQDILLVCDRFEYGENNYHHQQQQQK